METVSTHEKSGRKTRFGGDRLQCTVCGKSFGRSEHLKRHVISHTKERRFHCSHCNKEFIRRDALQRHELTHQQSGPTLLQKGARACSNCAGAKARCSGDRVCSRCSRRSLECVYPDTGNQTSENPLSNTDIMDNAEEDQPQEFEDTLDPNDHNPYMLNQQGSRSTASYPNDQFNNYPQNIDSFPPETFETAGGLSNDVFDPNYWNPGILSTINWLSNDSPIQHFDLDQQNATDSQFWDGFQQNQQIFAIPSASPHDERPSPSQQRDQPAIDLLQHPTPQSGVTTLSTISVDLSAHAAPTHEVGEFYVDGEAARLPRVKRRKITTKTAPKSATPIDNHFSLAFEWPYQQPNPEKPVSKINDDIYVQFTNAFRALCLTSTVSVPNSYDMGNSPLLPDQSSPLTVFSTTFAQEFPSKNTFEYLLSLCADSFLSTFPILPPDYNPTSWQLLLALAAIGSHYIEVEDSERFIISMHELLRRVLHMSEDDPSWLKGNDELDIIQIKLLHCVGLFYCGDTRLYQHGLKLRQDLAAFCEYNWQQKSRSNTTQEDDVENQWLLWKRDEIRRRTGYGIWLLDCQWSFHFQLRPILTLEQASIQLPCHEKVWTADSAESWKTLLAKFTAPLSLLNALQNIYIDKRLFPDTGEFSRILIIHGLFRRSWEVEAYFKQPLSQWTPTAQKQSSSEIQSSSSVWLPSIPTFTQWRNSACDCLDILHWSANAAIGAASGIEHPTVLHLHLARVILLTPYTHIINLALHLAGESSSTSTSDEISLAKAQIRRWAVHDQYKARLSMIHAGVTFWHIRRFSTNSFYEPSSVALATLALWAFSAFSNRPKPNTTTNPSSENNNNNTNPPSDSDSESSACEIILLDRPTDDELVQQFVRRGDTMRANVTGVGDLYGDRGAERVLLQGRRVLASLQGWAVAESWIRVLDNLAARSRRGQKKNGTANNNTNGSGNGNGNGSARP